jgi:hypothetical protein
MAARTTSRLDDRCVGFVADGQLVVVETDDDWFLGTAELTADTLIVRSGFVGRPVVLAHEEVTRIAPVGEYFTDDEAGPADLVP